MADGCADGVMSGVVEWVKKNVLSWFGHIERKNSEEFVKEVYMSEIHGPRRKGKPLVRWKDRVKEYMHERLADREGGIELARKECVDRER